MKFEPVGVYKFYSQSEVQARLRPDDPEDIRQQFSTLHLIELIASGVTQALPVAAFYQTQPRVAYDETYLDITHSKPLPFVDKNEGYVLFNEDDGTKRKLHVASGKWSPATEADLAWPVKHPTDGTPFRIIFFLHHYDSASPLVTPVGKILLPLPTPIPGRLKWKEYVHWD